MTPGDSAVLAIVVGIRYGQEYFLPLQLSPPPEPASSAVLLNCDLLRQAAGLLVRLADGREAEANRRIAEQISFLRRRAAALCSHVRDGRLAPSFMNQEPDYAHRVILAVDDLIESIDVCALAFVANYAGPNMEMATIACSLILQSVERLQKRISMRLGHDGRSPFHERGYDAYETIRALESEILRIVRREMNPTPDGESDIQHVSRSQAVFQGIQAVAQRCRDLMEAVEAMCPAT